MRHFLKQLPAIQLSLLDEQNQLIASRIFIPQDYLQADNAMLAFFESMHEIEIKLDFDSSNLNALGYRLQLLIPLVRELLLTCIAKPR
jgi:hypothetical protein